MTWKQTVSVDDVLALLNDALVKDRDAISALVENRVPCNQALADHPTIHVGYNELSGTHQVGLLGVLNGIFVTDSNGRGPIMAICADENEAPWKPGQVIRFQRSDLPAHP